jgi:protein-disulfide isomerase
MLRKLFPTFAVAAALLALAAALGAQTATPKKASALDKAQLEAYVRHLFVWPPPIEITVTDPKPGPLDGFYEVKVRGSQGEASQEESFYISKDGQKILRDSVFDIKENPFKAQLDLLKTQYQPAEGTAGAPVVIVEFSDFECPYCRQEAKVLHDNLLKIYPKEVRLYYLDFPLETLHPWAKDASIAGRCVFHQNAASFWDYNDWIFEHQEEVTPETLKPKVLDFAKDKGLDVDQLAKCMDTRATEDEVNKSKAEGVAAEVTSTPTLFVNGRRMVGTVAWEDLKRVIDFEIGYQATTKNAGDDCGCNVSLPMPGVPAAPASGLSPAAPRK